MSYCQYHSPYRAVPSPVVFGSLPSGAAAGIPWRTLLFRPQPGHFGATDPPDHLWLDLFWLPRLTPHVPSHPVFMSALVPPPDLSGPLTVYFRVIRWSPAP